MYTCTLQSDKQRCLNTHNVLICFTEIYAYLTTCTTNYFKYLYSLLYFWTPIYFPSRFTLSLKFMVFYRYLIKLILCWVITITLSFSLLYNKRKNLTFALYLVKDFQSEHLNTILSLYVVTINKRRQVDIKTVKCIF